MPSLADIPDDLLAPGKREVFIDWILKLRAPLSDLFELMHIWGSYTKQTFRGEDYSYVRLHVERDYETP